MNVLSASVVKARLHQGDEIALLDVREPGESGEGRPLLAINLPYSVLEARAITLLPSTTTPIVVMDDGNDDDRAARAAARLAAQGYADVSIMDGGLAAWAQAGYVVYKGVNVPSKVFGELLEHAFDTPYIDAKELDEMQRSDAPPIILDGRTPAEHQRMSIPGGISCPNAELGLRATSMAKEGQTIVVNCAGRTRSIVGAQTLIDLGIPNRVVALLNGTKGWRLAGLELDHDTGLSFPETIPAANLASVQGRVRDLMEHEQLPVVAGGEVDAWLDADDRAVYLLDVRTAEEYAAGHQPGAIHAPGGQLVQGTDQWVAARGARLVLMDAEHVRAPMTARWLRCMGHDVYVLALDAKLRNRMPAADMTHLPDVALLRAEELRIDALPAVVDVRPSDAFAEGHLPGAMWSSRCHLRELSLSNAVVVVADDEAGARMAAAELNDCGVQVSGWLAGVDDAEAHGIALVRGESLPDERRIDYLFFVHDRDQGNLAAAQQYLDWETGLVHQLDADEQALFSFGAGNAP